MKIDVICKDGFSVNLDHCYQFKNVQNFHMCQVEEEWDPADWQFHVVFKDGTGWRCPGNSVDSLFIVSLED